MVPLRFPAAATATLVTVSVATNVLMLTTPLYMMQIYDRVLNSQNFPTLVALTILALGALLFIALLEWLRSRMLVRLANALEPALDGVLKYAQPQARAMLPAPQAIDQLRQTLTGAGLTGLIDLPWVLLFTLVLFLLHPHIGWVTLAGVASLLGIGCLRHVSAHRTDAHRQSYRQMAAQQLDHANRAERSLPAAVLNLQDRARNTRALALTADTFVTDVQAASGALGRLVRQAVQVGTLAVAASLVLQGELSPGLIIAASILSGRALMPLDQVLNQWQSLRTAQVTWRRLVDATAMPEPQVSDNLHNHESLALELAEVSLRGADGPALSLRVPHGRLVEIVGASGAGKSWLARTIVGIDPVAKGTVFVGGASIENLTARQRALAIGYVSEHNRLLAGTVAENIRAFGPRDPERTQAIAKALGIDAALQRLPDGYDTDVAKHPLSASERFQILVAAALYFRPRLVVLDDPPSFLDRRLAERLQESLVSLTRDGATILWFGRQRVLGRADVVYALTEGGLIAAADDGRTKRSAHTPIKVAVDE